MLVEPTCVSMVGLASKSWAQFNSRVGRILDCKEDNTSFLKTNLYEKATGHSRIPQRCAMLLLFSASLEG